jgi:putative membrane protein
LENGVVCAAKGQALMNVFIKNIVTGFFIGIANIIPGVSGGTFLLIFGIYERTISAINGTVVLCKKLVKLLPHILTKQNRDESFIELCECIKRTDFFFLTQIIVGAGIAILVLSSLMKMLLTSHFSPTYAFFFGLISISIIIPVKLIKKLTFSCAPFFALGLMLTVYTTMSVNPSDKVLGKSEIYKNRLANQKGSDDSEERSHKYFEYNGKYSTKEFLYAMASGAVAISAMVLPGISGSLVLILMGQYFEVISAISGLKTLQLDYILFLMMIFSGIVLGILIFAKFIEFIFKKFYDPTVSFLTGLTAGSLYALWPFKKYIVTDIYVKEQGIIKCIENFTVYTNKNVLPESMWALLISILFCVIGILVMGFMIRFEGKKGRSK